MRESFSRTTTRSPSALEISRCGKTILGCHKGLSGVLAYDMLVTDEHMFKVSEVNRARPQYQLCRYSLGEEETLLIADNMQTTHTGEVKGDLHFCIACRPATRQSRPLRIWRRAASTRR